MLLRCIEPYLKGIKPPALRHFVQKFNIKYISPVRGNSLKIFCEEYLCLFL